jgi:hypothetical protein
MNLDTLITPFWFYIGLIMFLISLSKDTPTIRGLSVALFAVFCAITCLKSGTINQDIVNYVSHFDGMKTTSDIDSILLHWLFEPGYNVVVKLISLIYMFFNFDLKDEGLFIFLITLLPSTIFVWQFLKYRYSASVILFIYTTMILIASTTIIRHYYALAITFVILNRFILDSKRGGMILFSPILFHFTTIPIVFSLFLDNIKNKFYNNKLLISASVIFIIGFVFFGLDSFNYLVNKAYARVQENTTQQGGLRNILNLCVLSLILLRLDNFSLAKEKMNFLLGISALISIVLILFYGLNRVTSFFTLLILVYFFKYQKEKTANWILSLLSLAALIFFYLNHTIFSEYLKIPICEMYICEEFNQNLLSQS